MDKNPAALRSLLTALWLWALLIMPVRVEAAPPDLTAAGVIDSIDRTYSYNLGPTGLRGWIFLNGGYGTSYGVDGLQSDETRQILVTVVGPGTPAAGVVAVNDVILGVGWGTGGGAVPLFSSDARKSFGWAIGEAEKSVNGGILRLKRWRAGTTTDVSITLPVMGSYSDTAPYNCPKSALILANARARMVSQLLANPDFLIASYASAIDGLALLAAVAPGDPNYAEVQARLQTFARQRAAAGPPLEALAVWNWAYTGMFLAEYYLSTGDATVLPGISQYTIALAKGQSMYGTFGHNPSALRRDGSGRRSVIGYGPVNMVGVPANLAILLGRKALAAGNQPIDPEIAPAIQRGSDFFAAYVNRGSIPYGEHLTSGDNHSSNGKDALCAVFYGLQDNRAAETEFFTRSTIAGFTGREYGHTGQGFSYLWGGMGAAMGGQLAAAEYLKQVRWHLDLERRTDGSFVYDGQEQYGGGTTSDGTYLGASDYEGLKGTACYLLNFGLPLKQLLITGKNPSPVALDSAKVADAISAATFKFDCKSLTITQLINSLGGFDPMMRNYGAIELATRALTSTQKQTLRTMLTGSAVNGRMGACQTLGLIKDATALPLITQRLDKNVETDPWVRAAAASALRTYGDTAGTQLTPMLNAFNANATDPDVIVWTDPLQASNTFLSFALFGDDIGDGSDIRNFTINAGKNLLYPAVKAGLKQPDSAPRSTVSAFAYRLLTLADVQALPMDIINLCLYDTQADRMWSGPGRGLGIRTLGKYNFAEGIPLAMSMLETPVGGYLLGDEDYLIAALNTLAGYGDAARWTLPTLRGYLTTWGPSDQYNTLVNTIATIDAAIIAPAGISNLKAAANSQIVVTTGAKAITLSGSSCRDASVSFTNLTQPAHGTLTGTAPNLTYTPAAGYSGPDRFTFKTADSLTTSAAATVSIIVGSGGSGLTGEYFDNADFSNLKLTRTDPQVNFDWGTGSPSGLIGADTFSVRWSGQLLVPETGTYTFSTLSSDGVRLYIKGIPVINSFADQSTKWIDGAPIQLTAGQMVEIQMEYYENTGSAVAKLKWRGPSVAGEGGAIIPQAYLFDGTGISNRTAYANAQSVSMVLNTTQAITLTGSGGSLNYTILSQPSHGTLTGTAPYLTYTPDTNFTGADSFNFLVNNGTGNSTPATVSISIGTGLPASYTWKDAVSGNMSVAANWTSGSAPAAGGKAHYSLSFAPSGTYTVTHNLNNGFQLNQLDVAGNVTFAGTNTLSFSANGSVLPQFIQNSSSAVVVNTPLNLAATTSFGGNGSGKVTVTGLISGSGGLVKNSFGILQVNNLNNTYSGGTVLNDGTTTFAGGGGGVTPCLGTGPVTINPNAILSLDYHTLANAMLLNGGRITAGNSFGSFFTGPVTLTGITTFDFGDTGSFEISGNITGSGGLTTVGITQWSLSGANSFTGPTTIEAGGIRYQGAAAVGPGAINISTGAKANLNYAGNRVIASLTFGGIVMPPGSYGSTASPATFQNDNFFAGTGTVTVLPVTSTSLALTSGTTPANPGTPLTFTATVTGSSSTGNVAFYDNSALLGTSALNASYQAAFTTSNLAIGSHNITARYAGNLTNGTSTSNALAIEIASALPAAPTNLVATPGNGQNRLAWSIAAGADGYYVKRSLTSGGPFTIIGSSSAASYTDLTAANGTTYYYVVSAYNGSGESALSNQSSATASARTTTVALGCLPLATSASGTNVIFTATVTVSGAPATGTVTFKDGAVVLGTGSLSAGTAAFTTSTLAVGSHSITATYAGDGYYFSSVSAALDYSVTVWVQPITTTVINLGAPPAGTYFTHGPLYPKIPTGSLPPGSILRAVAWDVSLTQGDPYLGDLTVYIADSDGTNPVLQVGGFGPSIDGSAPYTAPLKLSWNAGGNYNIGAKASTTLTAADGVPAIDLNPKTVFLETTYNGGWAGTITLTYDLVDAVPAPPANPAATPGINDVGLTWSLSAGATGYYVKRSLTNGGPYTVIGSSSSTSYSDLTAVAGTSYYYVVSAFNGTKESANSSQVSAIAPGSPVTSAIVDNKSGGPVTINTLVTYTVTFSKDMDASSVNAAGFGNAGTAAFTIGAVSETSPTSGVFTVQVTPTSAGTLRLKINAGAIFKDAAGNNLDTSSAIPDDTTLTVQTAFEAWTNSTFANGPLTNKDMAVDFDGDGLGSGIEWVVGGDPTLASDAGKLPVFDTTSDPNFLIFSYRRTAAASADPKTTITVEYGSDLSGWTSALHDGTNVIITPSLNFYGAGVDKVAVKIKRTLAPGGKFFTRLKVTIAP